MPIAEKHLRCPLYSLMSIFLALGHSHSDTRYQEYRNSFKEKKKLWATHADRRNRTQIFSALSRSSVSELPSVMCPLSICLPASLGTMLQIDFSLRSTTASWQYRLNPGIVDIPLYMSPFDDMLQLPAYFRIRILPP